MKAKRGVKILVGFLVMAVLAGTAYLYHDRKVREDSYRNWEEILSQPILLEDTIGYGDAFDITKLYEQEAIVVKVEKDIDTSRLGPQSLLYSAEVTDAYDQTIETKGQITVHVVDTVKPEIRFHRDRISIYENGTIDFLENIDQVIDEIDGELSYQVKENIDLSKAGIYPVEISAVDKSGNAAKESFEVEVKKAVGYPYYIKINRAANTVTIYEKDKEGNYTQPVKAMVCSTGRATPLGTYQMYGKYRWRALFGNVYGQYGMTIVGDILFHSVPYYATSPSRLESEEYNKLGTAASLGCVRLCVKDVKWIYDNCPQGTTVTFYDDAENPGPLGKPESIQIDLTDERAGWDPTDPDENNPWNE